MGVPISPWGPYGSENPTSAVIPVCPDAATDEIVVPVVLSVARPMTADRLLFTVLRRTYEELDELDGLRSLPEEARRSLALTYHRI